MTTWLHFVGKSYYASEGRFEREAKRYGITRRVSLKTLAAMAWGDRVYLAQKSGASAVVFGQFTITKLSGLSPEGAALLRAKLGDRIEYHAYDAPRHVERGCGTYTVTGEFTIKETSLAAIAAILATMPTEFANTTFADPGKLMVGGTWAALFGDPAGVSPWEEPPVDRVRLKSVPFAQGFRPFDNDTFINEVIDALEARPGKPVTLAGHFYAKSDHTAAVEAGVAELVGDYRRGSHWEQGEL